MNNRGHVVHFLTAIAASGGKGGKISGRGGKNPGNRGGGGCERLKRF